jgi:hypothetical protein
MGAEQEGRVLTGAPLTLQGRQTALLPSCCQPVPQSFGSGVIFSPVTLISDAAHARARLCDASHRVIGEENGDGTDHGDHEAVQI